MKLNMELKLGLLLLFCDILRVACEDSPSAKALLRYDYQREKFVLEESVLRHIAALQAPLRIISVLGDARIGKSTNLNIIRHFLDGSKTGNVQKVFKTCENTRLCTSGVWMSSLRDKSNGGSIVLIDTEGTNVGDNEITDLLSIFTVLISSGLALFTRERISNHNIKFLYRVTRLSEQFWDDDLHGVNSYPNLMVVVRDALSPSPGNTLQSEIQDMILKKSQYGETIGSLFPRDRITVRNIPFVEDSKRLSDLQKFTKDDYYANIAFSLAADFKRFPCKRTIRGGVVDGKMMVKLARNLQAAINRNSWSELSNTYIALETHLCDRRFREIVEPLLAKEVEDIKRSKDYVMEQFVQRCSLAKEINYTRDQIANVIALKDEIRDKQRRLREEERKRQMEEARESQREEQRQREIREKEKRIGEERREREKAEAQRRILGKRFEELRKEQINKRAREIERRDIVRTVLGGGVLFAFLSDLRLKENITVLAQSEFELIGLHGYRWVWSRKAAEELGKRGPDHGVIAQEVEKLYPWAVVTGQDGYKRVNYAALKQLVLLKKMRELTRRQNLAQEL